VFKVNTQGWAFNVDLGLLEQPIDAFNPILSWPRRVQGPGYLPIGRGCNSAMTAASTILPGSLPPRRGFSAENEATLSPGAHA